MTRRRRRLHRFEPYPSLRIWFASRAAKMAAREAIVRDQSPDALLGRKRTRLRKRDVRLVVQANHFDEAGYDAVRISIGTGPAVFEVAITFYRDAQGRVFSGRMIAFSRLGSRHA